MSGIEYEELEIEIARCLCGKEEVRVLDSPFDRPREHFHLPFNLDTLDQHLTNLDDLLLKEDPEATARCKRLGACTP